MHKPEPYNYFVTTFIIVGLFVFAKSDLLTAFLIGGFAGLIVAMYVWLRYWA